ncbi:hypothetical protein ACVW00_002009 [Marmoricola sp. URHA0025 HA25]
MTPASPRFPDARLSVADDVEAPDEVLAPLHAYALGHATGSPEHFRRAFRPTAHIEGIRDDGFASWDLETYCAFFDGPAEDEAARSRVVESAQVTGTIAAATMRLHHGASTFTDMFVLVRDDGGWRIANKVYHRDQA